MGVLTEFPKAERFIETGTGFGQTLKGAAARYPQCYSIELAYEKYLEAIASFRNQPNVHLLYGHSPSVLKRLIEPEVSTVFWLDAHYTTGEVGMVQGYGNCPLREELAEIIEQPWVATPVILIDDLGTFERGLYNWPGLAELDTIMRGWTRQVIEGEIFSYVH